MIIKRLIDLNSIKENPDAGRTHYLIPGRTHIIENNDGTISQVRDIQHLYTLEPEPKYLFKYKDLFIKCLYCKQSFHIEELGYEEEYADNGDVFPIWDICPKCGEVDCVTDKGPVRFIFETIDEALARKT